MKESMSILGYACLVRRLRKRQEEFFHVLIDPVESSEHRLLHLISDRLCLESAVDAATRELLGEEDR